MFAFVSLEKLETREIDEIQLLEALQRDLVQKRADIEGLGFGLRV